MFNTDGHVMSPYLSQASCGYRWGFSEVAEPRVCDAGVKDAVLGLTQCTLRGFRCPPPPGVREYKRRERGHRFTTPLLAATSQSSAFCLLGTVSPLWYPSSKPWSQLTVNWNPYKLSYVNLLSFKFKKVTKTICILIWNTTQKWFHFFPWTICKCSI